MAITVKKTFFWKKELDNHPGAMAGGAQASRGRRGRPATRNGLSFSRRSQRSRSTLSERKLISTANSSGLAPSSVPVLLVEGVNRQGLGYALAKGIGDAGIPRWKSSRRQRTARNAPVCPPNFNNFLRTCF